MPLYRVRFSTKGIIDEMIIELQNDDVIVATNVLRLYYKVDNPILLSISHHFDTKNQMQKFKTYEDNSSEISNHKSIDIFAIITFMTGLLGFIFLPIFFIPICFICTLVSHSRLKENKFLTGEGLRITGAIINVINIIYLIYSYTNGTFNLLQ